jgi:hypothetical protein
MQPVGLTFKKEGEGRTGEIMLVHQCKKCGKISINRIAGDDDEAEIYKVFDQSKYINQALQAQLDSESIYIANEADRKEVQVQLFGR